MNQITIQNNGQHLPSKIQATRDPVKKVSNSIHQAIPKKLTANDLLGLSWVLFEEEDN